MNYGNYGNYGYGYVNGTGMYQSQPQPQTSNMKADWAQGEAAARVYPTTPGMITLLMDSDQPVLYVKMADASGRPMPLEVYDLVKREANGYTGLPQNNQPQPQVQYVQQDMSEYVKAADLESKVTELINKALGGK